MVEWRDFTALIGCKRSRSNQRRRGAGSPSAAEDHLGGERGDASNEECLGRDELGGHEGIRKPLHT